MYQIISAIKALQKHLATATTDFNIVKITLRTYSTESIDACSTYSIVTSYYILYIYNLLNIFIFELNTPFEIISIELCNRIQNVNYFGYSLCMQFHRLLSALYCCRKVIFTQNGKWSYHMELTSADTYNR